MVVKPLEGSIKVDRFGQTLLSSDQTLKLNIGDTTEIILQDGKPFAGELANRDLVVFYDVATRSIPAQTTPQKVVVLSGEADPPAYDLPLRDADALLPVVRPFHLLSTLPWARRLSWRTRLSPRRPLILISTTH